MNIPILTASHYGVVHFGDLECEAVVLKGGERGYVRRQLAKLLGFHEGHKGGRFARFLTDFAPNSLSELEKTSEPILLPSARQTQFFPAGIIADLASAVVNAALTGTLHKARKGIVPNCMKIMHALATTGEVALIDEATGYQFHRAPDALQDLIAKLLRQSSGSWERRFHADYAKLKGVAAKANTGGGNSGAPAPAAPVYQAPAAAPQRAPVTGKPSWAQ